MAPQNTVIAIIDDDLGIREALKQLVSAHGYRTELYASAAEFINAVLVTEASCLIVDMQLGDITGVELGRHLSATGFGFPIVFITGSTDDVLRRQALDFGCIAYLHKPIAAALLMDAIRRATSEIDGLG